MRPNHGYIELNCLWSLGQIPQMVTMSGGILDYILSIDA